MCISAVSNFLESQFAWVLICRHIKYHLGKDVIQGISELYRSLVMTKSVDTGQLLASLDK